jgi:hypothetical protein
MTTLDLFIYPTKLLEVPRNARSTRSLAKQLAHALSRAWQWIDGRLKMNNGFFGVECRGRHTACILAVLFIKWFGLILELRNYKAMYRPRHHNTHATTLQRERRPHTHVLE